MNQLEAMRVLLAVVDTGSLSAAGRKLAMPLATVSRKIGQLEAHLKARLLKRSTRQLVLTETGREYVAACRRILDDVHAAERTVAGEYHAPRGEVVVTAPIVFGRLHVLPVVCEFLRAYPEVNVRLVLGDRILNLFESQVDLAIRIGALPDSSLTSTTLGRIRRLVCASPAYLAEHGTPRHPRALGEHRCISFEPLAGADQWRFRIDGRDVAVPVRSRLVVNTAEAVVDAAIAGTGISCVLSYQAEPAVREGRLTPLLQDFEPAPMPVSFLYTGAAALPLKLRALLDFAAPRLRARLKDVEASLASRARPAPGRRAKAKLR